MRPPFYSIFGTEKKVGNIPLGLCYLASSLEEAGHTPKILDCETMNYGDKTDSGEMSYTHDLNVSYEKYARVMGDEDHPFWRTIVEVIMAYNADIVGFTAKTATMSPVIYISKMIEESDAEIYLGGVHATALPTQSLKETGADVAVIGEGERTMVELANGVDVEDVRGIAYRKGPEIKVNEPREPIENLDSIPFPARHLLDRSKYKDSAFGYLIASRGCPFDCNICASKTLWGRITRFRSTGNVLDEVEQVTKYTSSLRLTDDTFTLSKERVLDFCEGLKRRGLDVSFRCGARTDRFDEEIARALKSARCSNVSFGVETGSQRILDLIGKQTTVEHAVRSIEIAKQVGLDTLAFFIVGHPTETLNEVKATCELIDRLGAHRTSVSIMTPYPGTKLFEPHFGNDWWRYYHQGKAVKNLSTLSDEKLNEVYSDISRWVKTINLKSLRAAPC